MRAQRSTKCGAADLNLRKSTWTTIGGTVAPLRLTPSSGKCYRRGSAGLITRRMVGKCRRNRRSASAPDRACAHRKNGIDAAMELDDLIAERFAHPHVVDFIESDYTGCERAQKLCHLGDAGWGRVLSCHHLCRQWFDMRLDLDLRLEFVAHRLFKSARHIVRRADRQGALDLDRQAAGNRPRATW